MNRDYRVLAIVLAAQHLLGFAGVDLDGQLVERPPEVVGHRLPRLDPFGEDGKIFDTPAERVAQFTVVLEPASPLQQLLCGRLILPEVRGGDALFDCRELARWVCGVKDSSAGRWRAAPDPRTCEADRRVEGPWGISEVLSGEC
jgi:hypothetical protein